MTGADNVDDARLRETAERVGALAQSMGDTEALRVLDEHPAPLVVMRGESEVTFCNAAFCDVVGYTREDLLALDPMSLVISDDREATRARQRSVSRGDTGPGPHRLSIVRKDGEMVEVVATATVFRVRGEVVGRLTMLRTTV